MALPRVLAELLRAPRLPAPVIRQANFPTPPAWVSDGGKGITFTQRVFNTTAPLTKELALQGRGARLMIVASMDSAGTLELFASALPALGGALAGANYPEAISLTRQEYGDSITGEIWIRASIAAAVVTVTEYYRL